MAYFKKMKGSKCYLSPVDIQDAETYTAWFNDLEVTIFLTVAPQVISLTKERELLERLLKDSIVFAIVDNETDKLIGNCGLMHVDELNRTAELGIFIGSKEHWSRGYGEEAIRLLLDFAFNFRNLHNVILQVFAYNRRGMHCYRKCGFKEVGRRRQAKRIGGRAYDIVLMDILSDEFHGSLLDKLLPGEGPA